MRPLTQPVLMGSQYLGRAGSGVTIALTALDYIAIDQQREFISQISPKMDVT